MKRGMTILLAAALTFAMAGPVMAQNLPTRGAVTNADYAFFASHPNVMRALEKDPTLIDNQQWVAQHPALHEYLKTHPYIRHEFKSHPYDFMHEAERVQKHPQPGEYMHGGEQVQKHQQPGEYTHGGEPYQKHHE